jgi:hypothetical protein
MKRVAVALASLLLAAGFVALAVWGVTSGIAAGSLGAATRADAPGAYCFILAGLGTFALVYVRQGLRALVPRWRLGWLVLPGFAAMLPLGAWMLIELGLRFWRILAAVPDKIERLIYAGLAIALVSVIATLLYTLVWPTVRDILRGRD